MAEDWERRLNEATRKDSWYQQMLSACDLLSAEYAQFKNSLTPEDQAALERYLSLCEELEYRRTRLAYALGT